MNAPAAPTTTPAPAANPAGAGNPPVAGGSADPPTAQPDPPAGDQSGGTAEGTPAEEAPSESIELGGESKSGTDQSGGEADRHEFRQGARHLYGGDRVGGDKLVFHLSTGKQSPPPRRLSPTLEDLARHAFVPPDGWDRCRNDFRDRRTVVLRGAPGQGRATMAIRLLQTVESTAIFDLDPRVDLPRMAEQLTAQPLPRGTAFLLHQPEDAARLDAYTFHSIETALTAADAWLVVTVGNEVSFLDEDLLRYQLNLPAAPARRQILTRHLNHLVGEERAEQIVDHPGVSDLVTRKLDRDDVACKRAAFLAWLLGRAADPIDVAEVETRLQRHSTDEFEIWFETLDTVKLRCVAVALAVLDGLPYEDVADAARRLHSRLSSGGKLVLGEGSVLKVAGSDPFQPSQARLLELLQAQVEGTTTRTPYGHAPATTIAYRDPEYPRQVIGRAWKSYQIEDKLLDWLGELVTTGSQRVRIHAGTALGTVARLAFEYVRLRVLVPWAHDRSLWKNEAVAEALRVVAEVPELQSGTAWLVDRWYREENPDAQCTAALAHGTRLGRPSAARSIEALARLAIVDDPSVRVGIARGFASLLADDRALAPEIYQVLSRCLADRDRTITGQFVFLVLAEDVAVDVPGIDGTTVRWPALLRLATEHPQLRTPLCECWARVLTEGRAVTMAQRVLRAWAGRAEADPGVRESFTRTVRAVAQFDTRAGAVLARCAKQWNSDEELQPMPTVALATAIVVAA